LIWGKWFRKRKPIKKLELDHGFQNVSMKAKGPKGQNGGGRPGSGSGDTAKASLIWTERRGKRVEIPVNEHFKGKHLEDRVDVHERNTFLGKGIGARK